MLVIKATHFLVCDDMTLCVWCYALQPKCLFSGAYCGYCATNMGAFELSFTVIVVYVVYNITSYVSVSSSLYDQWLTTLDISWKQSKQVLNNETASKESILIKCWSRIGMRWCKDCRRASEAGLLIKIELGPFCKLRKFRVPYLTTTSLF